MFAHRDRQFYLSGEIFTQSAAIRNFSIPGILAYYPACGQTCGMTTYPVGKAAKLAGIGPTTARDYLRAYPEHFSEGATPPSGSRRVLTWQDIETLATIKQLRQQGNKDESIRASLATGERESIQPHAEDTDATGQTTALVAQLSAAAARWEASAGTIAEERDYLRQQLATAQSDILAAEIARQAAETELKILREVTEQNNAQGEKLGWWDRFLGRGG